jgi:aryl-alcohol dehydrogenase-like predicted oxidoreductase
MTADARSVGCRELGIGITAYGVLARGLLSGNWTAQLGGTGPPSAFAAVPAGNVEALRTIADARGVTVGQLAIAWVLAQGQQRGDIVAVVGARTPQRLAETLPGAELTLTADDLAAIERAVPVTGVAGERYPAPQLAHLDGER